MLTKEQRLDLVVATLATYNYPLEKAWGLRDRLDAAGLSEPASVIGRSVEDVGNALKAAGYDRGGITYIIAPRIANLLMAAADGDLAPLSDAILRGDEPSFSACLASVKGLGAKAARTAWLLLSSPQSQ